jgi:hypothetical protein
MPAPIINPEITLPDGVRASVLAEGSATWKRSIPGVGVLVFETTRGRLHSRHSGLVTKITGMEPAADDAANTDEGDLLDFAMIG